MLFPNKGGTTEVKNNNNIVKLYQCPAANVGELPIRLLSIVCQLELGCILLM